MRASDSAPASFKLIASAIRSHLVNGVSVHGEILRQHLPYISPMTPLYLPIYLLINGVSGHGEIRIRSTLTLT